MSNEKKLKSYAENRLSAYADGEDSLARLKRVQAAQKEQEPQAQKAPARAWVKRFAFTFTVVIVAVVAVLLVRLAPGGSYDTVKERGMSSGGNYAKEGSFADNGVAFFSEAAVNAETVCLDLALPDGAALQKLKVESPSSVVGDKTVDSEKAEEKEGYYYLYSVEEDSGSFVGGAELIVAFGGYEPEWGAFEPELKGFVVGQTFAYTVTQEGLLGKIQTEKETIYVRFLQEKNVQACLDWLGSILIQK